MAKFLPVVGEIYTGLESGMLMVCAGVAKVFGDDEAARELAHNAGNSWKEYTETNILTTPINVIVQNIKGNREESDRLKKTLANAASGFVDGVPVAGHVKGIVHYAMGDTKKGHQSMEASSKSLVVLGAGVVTGGLGGGAAAGALAGVGTGVTYDGVATAIDKVVNGDDGRLHGSIALAEADKMKPSEIMGTVAGIVGDGFTGAAGAQIGRNIRAKVTGQKRLQKAYESSGDIKKTGLDPKEATKCTMDTAKESHKAQTALKKDTGYATSKVVDKTTGDTGVGHSSKYRKQMKIENRSAGQSKGAAAREAISSDPSHLQMKYPDVQQVVKSKPQVCCAEHSAFNELAKKNPNYRADNVTTSTVYKNKLNNTVTKQRCPNCKAYKSGMGNVITDCIPDETPVPNTTYVRDGNAGKATAAVCAGACMTATKMADKVASAWEGIDESFYIVQSFMSVSVKHTVIKIN